MIQNSHGIFISQCKYSNEILDKFDMSNSKPVGVLVVPGFKLSKVGEGAKLDATYYKQIVGILMYLISTRPDIMYSVALISRYMENPTEIHMQAAKRVMRYLKGTTDLGILYIKPKLNKLPRYTDNDYAGDLDDRRSTSRYAFILGNGAIAWASKKQPIVTLSTTKAEFIAAALCAC